MRWNRHVRDPGKSRRNTLRSRRRSPGRDTVTNSQDLIHATHRSANR
jgi:hypothetical protein